jgi:exonuclease-1
MGVTGLIKFVEKACDYGRIEALAGKTVAIDSYCLLHKGAYSCSDKLVSFYFLKFIT